MKRTKLIAFAALALPLAGVTMPITAFVPAFYASQMGLSLATIGVALMALRIADVFVDLLIGYLSDATKTKYGRRRPWIAAGVVLLIPAIWMCYAPVGDVTIAYLMIWAGLAYIGWSLVNIPYSASALRCRFWAPLDSTRKMLQIKACGRCGLSVLLSRRCLLLLRRMFSGAFP